MVNLFRDPECKSVIVTLKDEPTQGTLSMVTVDNSTRSDVIDAMQKRIDEQDSYIKKLELQIDSYQQSILHHHWKCLTLQKMWMHCEDIYLTIMRHKPGLM